MPIIVARMETWHTRLRRKMEEKGWSAVELARRADLPEQSIYKYLQGKVIAPRGQVIQKLAAALETTEIWLAYGASNEKMEAVKSVGFIPVLDLSRWDGDKRGLTSMAALAVEAIPIGDTNAGPRAFAVRISDDAMTELPRGSLVVVDPDSPAEPGRYVSAWSSLIRRAVIRRWRATDYTGLGMLIADNPHYPEIALNGSADGYIIGRVTMLIVQL